MTVFMRFIRIPRSLQHRRPPQESGKWEMLVREVDRRSLALPEMGRAGLSPPRHAHWPMAAVKYIMTLSQSGPVLRWWICQKLHLHNAWSHPAQTLSQGWCWAPRRHETLCHLGWRCSGSHGHRFSDKLEELEDFCVISTQLQLGLGKSKDLHSEMWNLLSMQSCFHF